MNLNFRSCRPSIIAVVAGSFEERKAHRVYIHTNMCPYTGLGETHARRTNTAKRALNMLTHRHHVRVHVCTSSTQWEFQTNPDQSSETTSSINNVIGAGETSRNEQITSCLGSDGQHARPSCKHCKACVKHAHAPPPRARTRLYKFHSVGISNQPGPVQ